MSIVSTAEKYIGKVRYEFGADNVDGGVGDCSSFTQTVFKKNGVDIGRDTITQYTKGTAVDKENLKPGDLVFFQGTYREGVSHVGIYIGNGQFIHNSSTKGVTTGNLNNEYWTNHWLGGRRVSTAAGGTINPTFTADQVQTDSEGVKLDVVGQLARFIIIVGLIILAVVFFLGAFGSSPTKAVKNTVKTVVTKKVNKNDE